ncbi:TIGR00153 family protein [Desulfonema ishimotonii]|uniref:TIGR00153 family protein n=1 Tax=Desulfonema ishimotonii TaxID=45657 RepID=A0A401G3A7_9BACT|nr:TIGR00153 family protein [Desulfonema ishimotonii]GBC63661.1 TIGR00153 family protein [Desulfonema ishimotonii]
MRIPFLSLFITSPFDGLQEHAEKVKECAWIFQHAIECHMVHNCKSFTGLREEVIRLESEADVIKRRIRGHIPVGTFMQVDKFQLFRYLKEQDNVLDSLEDVLDWISYREEPGIPEVHQKEFFLLIDSVIDPIEELSRMVAEARKYFKNYSDKQRTLVKEIIGNLRKQEHEADKAEDLVKKKVFNMEKDPVTVFHLVRLAETLGAIADHAENAGDMMRAMLSR